MGRGAAIAIATAVTMASLVACSLATDFGGLDGPPADDASIGSDGTTPASDASPSDDGATANDAGAPDGDASVDGGSFCQSKTGLVFCADFDDVVLPSEGWTKAYGGLSVELDSTKAASPLHALRVTAPGLDGGTNAQGALELTLNGTPSAVTATADLYIEDPKPMSGGLFVAFALYLGTDYDVYLEIDPDKTIIMEKLAANTTSFQSHQIAPFTFGTWVHLELVYESAGGPKLTVRRTVAGTPQETSFALTLATGATTGTYGLRAGLPYVGGVTSPASIWTDNVTLASTP